MRGCWNRIRHSCLLMSDDKRKTGSPFSTEWTVRLPSPPQTALVAGALPSPGCWFSRPLCCLGRVLPPLQDLQVPSTRCRFFARRHASAPSPCSAARSWLRGSTWTSADTPASSRGWTSSRRPTWVGGGAYGNRNAENCEWITAYGSIILPSSPRLSLPFRCQILQPLPATF